jgi:RNA polymerase sigma-70 factor (ECF subfamily)
VYEPVVYRLARHSGLQDADARDLCQEVLLAVAAAIERWEPDRERGRFRTWLYRVAKNMAINALSRRKWRAIGQGGTSVLKRLLQEPDHCVGPEQDEQATRFQHEYRRQAFHWAAEQIRTEFRPGTWQAFWQTTVEGHDIAAAAARLQMSVGAVYAARSRVLARLRRKVEELTRNEE